jgi:chromosome segregation protein
MRFSRLRLLGFKSFVDPMEFVIEPGLTGIVGPNGCGKSNLVEALRWVMGENSYKNMRASGMDDVIFSGSATRPSRNTAEVTLFLDNQTRTAPAAFNDADELQVSRRIEREAGSVYRINGKEARARDVQLLFADASTGARSPSMVGQGRIGELIQAKPQARRALLEEAAGISGLHSRRHEAELRLRAAEQNLERLDDVTGELGTQIENLKRQARQASRFKTLSADIRQAEAILLHLRWTSAKAAEGEAHSALSTATVLVGERAATQLEAAKAQAIAAQKLPGLREAEAAAAAALQRLGIARAQIDEEAARLAARRDELDKRIAQFDADRVREEQLLSDHAGVLSGLDEEERTLNAEQASAADREAETGLLLEEAQRILTASETALQAATAARAEASARRAQLERSRAAEADRAARLARQIAEIDRESDAIAARIAGLPDPAEKQAVLQLRERELADAEAGLAKAEPDVERARNAEAAARGPLDQARATLQGIETEARTLAKILNAETGGLFPPVLDRLKVTRGYETALGAALGDDLEGALDASAPVHWTHIEAAGDPALPAGATPLAEHVSGPVELARRLAQTGVVEEARGAELQKLLKPGQRLVTRDGALWRWDGLIASADAPTAAAQRLANRNRLAELDASAIEATKTLRQAEAALADAAAAVRSAIEAERGARDRARVAQKSVADAREELSRAEKASGEFAARRDALTEARARLAAEAEDATRALAAADAALLAEPELAGLQRELDGAQARAASDRAAFAEARAAFDGLKRETETRARRLAAIARERDGWIARAANANSQIAALAARRAEADAERTAIADAPDEIDQRRRALMGELGVVETRRKEAADRLAAAETAQAGLDKAANQAIIDLSQSREARGRAEERSIAAEERRKEAEARIAETLGVAPHLVIRHTGLAPDAAMPDLAETERRLERLKIERERLGAVNLRAEEEAREISERLETIVREREDVIEAIRTLRQGIQNLNREGRERLTEAFGVVNGHFQRLFTHLFGGGTAELQLIESDDPLEAGLEILARPPGKKPQTMTLLSGGEQALTAMALIFAVFLTNPAPICVLDEVDAPLDDHNVERFCNLMDEMARTTDTKFVIITHNPITMARMNRLFGVTMGEQGVSQLVSVDLQTAEQLREAG